MHHVVIFEAYGIHLDSLDFILLHLSFQFQNKLTKTEGNSQTRS